MRTDLISELGSEMADIDRQLLVLKERRDAIERVLATYRDSTVRSLEYHADTTSLSTIEMARQVLEANGSPMGTAAIRRAIQRKFGAMPASSLQQMLYMRAAQGKVFYNDNKKYGLLSWKTKVNKVQP